MAQRRGFNRDDYFEPVEPDIPEAPPVVMAPSQEEQPPQYDTGPVFDPGPAYQPTYDVGAPVEDTSNYFNWQPANVDYSAGPVYETGGESRNPVPGGSGGGTTASDGATVGGPFGQGGSPYPYSAGGQTYNDFLLSMIRSGVSYDEAKKTADIVFGQGGNPATINNPAGGTNTTATGGDPVRDPIRKFITDVLASLGRTPTGPGSGPTDIEYYVDRILQEGGLNTGYDWAARIRRGVEGTQPPLPTAGGAQGGGLSLDAIRALGEMLSRSGPSRLTVGQPNLVGSDPFSQTITGGLANIIGSQGFTPQMMSVFSTLQDIIGRSGKTFADDAIVQQQLEGAREASSRAFGSQLADARSELAGRGLVSEPGVGQGAEAGAIDRISTNLAPAYSSAVRDVHTAALQRQNDRLVSSLQTITGLSQGAASNLLNALGQGTQRQAMLADIALRQLDQSRQWQQFLASYGLSRDMMMTQIAQGNAASLTPLLALFEQMLGTAAGGQV